MKIKIISILALVLLIITIIASIFGIKLLKIKISSVNELKVKNTDVITKIEEANKYATEEYPKHVSELEDNYKEYKDKKNQYKQLTEISDSKNKDSYETKKYDITYLWKKLGSYANNRNLWLGIDVKKNINELYNLAFTIKGDYADIIQYIADIENDSEFYFRIYNFKMVEENPSRRIVATFSVKDINIDSSTINS